MNEIMTPTEKEAAKKAGKFYLKIIKTAGVFFLLGLILTGASLATSDPAASQVTLDSGESTYLHQFFGEAGDRVQFAFGINEMNGQMYNYEGEQVYYNDYDGEYYAEGIDSPWDALQYMEDMEWYVQLQVQYSEDINFKSFTVVKDISGEINMINMELYQDGFYRMKITNQHTENLTVGVIKAEANLALIASAVIAWVVFGVTMSIFVFAVHVGFWILVAYIVIKAIKIIQEDNNRSYPQIIGPQDKAEA